MLSGIWRQFVRRRKQAAEEHEVERGRMTDDERRADERSIEDRQADLATQARFGGEDPARLLPDDNPEHR